MPGLQVGTRRIGPGQPVFIIAEIGYNFNTVEEGKRSIGMALECGADAVKFQTFRAETLTSRKALFPAEAGGTNQFEEFRRYELSPEAHEILFGHARRCGILPFSTPGHDDDVELLEQMGVPLFKIGSDDLTNLPFLGSIARKGKPIILSTGMGTEEEVTQAVETLQRAGNTGLALLHCVSNYPVRDPSHLNLRAIPALRERFGLPVGFSDHTTGMTASLGAVALGACIIERHFTIDKKLETPDAFFSADPLEMKALVQAIREMELSLGNGVKQPSPSERQMREQTRKSILARVSIRPGERLTAEKVIIKRPATGLAPAQLPSVLGRRVRQAVAEDEPITSENLE